MSQIITSQPKTPVTATYVILGTSIAYVLLWNITSELLTKLLIISVFGGIIASMLYYLELFQLAGNALLQSWYRREVIKNFPEFMDVSYDHVFGEPYFEHDRNKIYGILYLFVAIVIALVRSPIPLSSIPLEIQIGALLGGVFLLVVCVYLVHKQIKRIKDVHYILALERYSSGERDIVDEPNRIVDEVKNDLIGGRWISVMSRIKKAKDKFYFNKLNNFYKMLSENREKWHNITLKYGDTRSGFDSNALFRSDIQLYQIYSSIMEAWLYVFDPRVYSLFQEIIELIKLLKSKKYEIVKEVKDGTLEEEFLQQVQRHIVAKIGEVEMCFNELDDAPAIKWADEWNEIISPYNP